MKEYLSIKEFARFSRIEQTTLRYWDDIGLFSPSKRDPDNNYRYYSPEQIIAVKFIAVLSDLNIPLKAIANIEQDRDPEKIIRLISERERLLGLELLRIQQQFTILHTRRRLIEEGNRAIKEHDLEFTEEEKKSGEISKTALQVIAEEEMAYIVGPRNKFANNGEFYESFVKFCTSAEEQRIKLSLPIAGRHDRFENFLKLPGGPDNFISIDPRGNRISPAGNYLAGYVRGFYGQLANIHEEMLAYTKEHELKPVGPVYTEYLHDEICLRDPIDYLAKVSVRVEGA
ncbi:MAG: MerR family transcriptional regulator [Coriobacteriia bacterium]|nr:MerR family transcriptional regulator [Coriobacteriia bacterium]